MDLSASVSIKHTNTGLEYLAIDSPLCRSKIFLQGAQLTEFTPKGKKSLIWVSQDEDYCEGKAIRGGIPICWPWFGVSEHNDWPIHGVARSLLWRAEEVHETSEFISVKLSLPMRNVDPHYWDHPARLEVEFILSEQLEIKLTNTNLGDFPFTLTQALHTYFPTADITQTSVDGLQGSNYIEFGEGPFVQNECVTFNRETDMVYTQVAEVQTITTAEGVIEVSRGNSTSCVLWNPWVEKAKRLSNFQDDEYKTMLCLESANVMDDAIVLQPKQSHTLSTVIRWL